MPGTIGMPSFMRNLNKLQWQKKIWTLALNPHLRLKRRMRTSEHERNSQDIGFPWWGLK